VRLGEEVRVADASRELVLVKVALEQFGRDNRFRGSRWTLTKCWAG